MKLYDANKHSIKKLKKIADKVISYEEYYSSLKDSDLREKTNDFKNRYRRGESLDSLLPEAFALVREASNRTLHMLPYPEQIMAGIALHQGTIAEQKTGEGKSLMCAMPAYLNAITGNGVHIVTVNEYLAKRDAEEIGQIYRFLGLTVGISLSHMGISEKKEAYGCDITYVTNNELGFDYLRDNMATSKSNVVLRDLNYCIIDEVDSILIDEARTPLIISGEGEEIDPLYKACDFLVKTMRKGSATEVTKALIISGDEITESGDYVMNEKDRLITLTADGIKKVESFFKIDNYADTKHMNIQHHITIALRANYLMHRDIDYIVKNGEILIVDEFTGRVMLGRRFSDGLHQAIEAKENVEIKKENKTLATITFQNFFNKYDKLAGMTGTAVTEKKEFKETYGLNIIVIPTHKPVIRKDLDDVVCPTKEAKYKAVVKDVLESYQKGQPVLVGTADIEVSETLSKMFNSAGIPHNVLNAKNDELESEIISRAGEFKAVTIATNMAGRGTDIKLDDNAREAGGLKVIGTERHESRRIDNQLRGRSGRQGDPGESRFYISLEDNLMRLFCSESMLNTFKAISDEEDPIHHKMLTKSISNAQKKIEENNFGIRKNLLEYDKVNNEQREIIYKERNKVLAGENMKESILYMLDSMLDKIVNNFVSNNTVDFDGLNLVLKNTFDITVDPDTTSSADLKKELYSILNKKYADQEAIVGDHVEIIRDIERQVLLKVIDMRWMQQIDDMAHLKDGIGLQAYAQKDPKVAYKTQGFALFNDMMTNIQADTLRYLYHLKITPITE